MPDLADSSEQSSRHGAQSPTEVRILIALLQQLHELVHSLTPEEFTQSPVGTVESSIGGHIRHILDHVASLLSGLHTGSFSYDQRERNTTVETERVVASAKILHLENALIAFPWATAQPVLNLTMLISPNEPPVILDTTIVRELAFVISHTVHHNAIIRVMLATLGRIPPPDFGYAPSTIVYMRSRECARSA